MEKKKSEDGDLKSESKRQAHYDVLNESDNDSDLQKDKDDDQIRLEEEGNIVSYDVD